MQTESTVKTINLTPFGEYNRGSSILCYVGYDRGAEVAEACGLKKALEKGMVNFEAFQADGWSYVRVDDAWIRGFIGKIAREIGIDVVLERLHTYNRGATAIMLGSIHYLEAEQKRLKKAAIEKERKNGSATWSETGRLLIPEIGTFLLLEKDWAFNLHYETRNGKILQAIGVEFDWRKSHSTVDTYPVVIKAGSTLSVDRIYIRRGKGDYSSLSFNLLKGSTLEYKGKTCQANGRFWAKLSEVNQMIVKVDMKTLAEN